MFSLRGFSRCACRRSLPAGAELASRAGASPSFLDAKRKEAKIRQRGEFRFSPPWNSLSTTKGAAFGNREKLPLWFCFTHRHGLRVKRVCKSSFSAQRVQEIFERWNTICKSANRNYRQAALLRANESALKMPADRRDSKTDFPMKLGEWAFSLERLTDSFRLHSQEPFPKRIPKVSFGRPLLTFVLSRK